tara:strand:- start:327 stop:470 length:144 start_codon:yes stop_codon:yes gene_type:complete
MQNVPQLLGLSGYEQIAENMLPPELDPGAVRSEQPPERGEQGRAEQS